jgi:hypothetical protein
VILVPNVLTIYVQSNLIFGTFGATTQFGKLHQGGWFFVDASSGTNRSGLSERLPALSESEFHQVLATNGVTNNVTHPVKPLIKEFMFKGVLPFGQ